MKHKLTIAAALLLSLTLVTGCGGTGSSDYGTASYSSTAVNREMAVTEAAEPQAYYDDEVVDYYESEADDGYAYENPATAGGGDISLPILTESQPVTDQPRKIIYTMDISLQTKEFDSAIQQIPAMVEEVGGFVQDSYVEGTDMNAQYYSRYASFTVRIPVEKLDAYMTDLGESFHLVSERKSSSDITGNYYDTKSRLESLEVRKEGLMVMLEGATELQYMLEVERELAEVLYQIDNLTSSLQRMEGSVSYSTVNLYLQEVSDYPNETPVVQPVSFGERIGDTFRNSVHGLIRFCQNAVLYVISLITYLPVFLVLLLIVILVVRRHKKVRGPRAKAAAETTEVLSEPTEAENLQHSTPPEQE